MGRGGAGLSEWSIACNCLGQCAHMRHAISMQILACQMLHKVGVFIDTFSFGSRYCSYCEGRECPCIL